MKKLIFACVLAVASLGVANAQSAIGARFGSGIDFSYLHGLNSGNRVSIDAGFPMFWGFEAAATHDWMFPINGWKEKGSWNWYAGVGGAMGIHWNGHFNFGVAGRVGVEYNFWFPLQLSFDWRPVIGPGFGPGYGSHNGGFYTAGLWSGGIGLGVRYILN